MSPNDDCEAGENVAYREAAASLREILSSADKVAITTDAWTALTTESYVNFRLQIFI